jgi:hypothetical protein
MFKMSSWKWLVVTAVLVGLAASQPARAATAPSDPVLTIAGKPASDDPDALPPMPGSAQQGLWCLGGAVSSVAAAYAVGPSEVIMMVTGAMHVPSSGPLVFLPLYALLASGSCALASAAQPAISWASEQSSNIARVVSDRLLGLMPTSYADAAVDDANKSDVPAIRPMETGEMMSAGCVVGAGGGLLGSLAAGPMEVVMLAAGGITVASSTPVLAMGLLGTIVASGCAVGNYALLPVVTLFQSLTGNGGSSGQAQNPVVSPVGFASEPQPADIALALGNSLGDPSLAGLAQNGAGTLEWIDSGVVTH